jgi:uncharacterized protein YqgV (UPF0045/DUF77 family)
MKKHKEKQENEGKNLEINHSRLNDLLTKKRKACARFPDNHHLKNDIEIIQNLLTSFETFIEDDYNSLVSFVQSIHHFLKEYGISEDELMTILHNPEASTTHKKNAVLRSIAKTYQRKADMYKAKYDEIYYLLTNGRLDLAMQKIDDENEKLKFWSVRLLEIEGKPCHHQANYYANFKIENKQ